MTDLAGKVSGLMILPRRILAWIGRHELATLLILMLVVGAVWIFTELADEVIEGDTHAFDEAILLAMRDPANQEDPWGPGWIEELGRDFTALGGTGVLTVISLSVLGFLVIQRKSHAAILMVVAIVGGMILSNLLKHQFDRPRPDLVPHGSIVYTASFPSGHSMLSAVTYLTLGAILARVQPRLRMKAYILLIAILLTVLVGVSRVYLGVHWPTDVMAGWTAGAAWAALCWGVARYLQRRGQVEEDVEEPEPPVTDAS